MKPWLALAVLCSMGGITDDASLLVRGDDSVTYAECTSSTAGPGTYISVARTKQSYALDVSGGCKIYIQPNEGGYTNDWGQLSFSEINLIQGEITIMDAESGGNQLWYCIGCNTDLPPPMDSATGDFFIKISAGYGATSKIILSWFVVNVEMLPQDDAYVWDYKMPFGVLRAPAAGGTDESPGGIIPQNLDWRWRLRPDISSSDSIILMVTDISLSADSGDTLIVYDGLNRASDKELATFTSSSSLASEWSISSEGEMMVVLNTQDRSSDEDVSGSFRARFMTRGATNAVYQGDYSYCGYVGTVDAVVEYTGDSMIITDGSATYNPQHENDACRMKIAPKIAQSTTYTGTEDKVTLIMSMVSMKDGGSLSVYDGQSGDSTSTLLWDCEGCGLVAPPPLVSTTGYFYINYGTSAAATSYLGFEAKYFTNWADGMGFGDREIYLRMATATSIRCPSFEKSYPQNLDHIWWIKPNSKVDGTSIHVMINRIDFSEMGVHDNLTIYDGEWSPGDAPGTVLATYTGRSYPTEWIVAPTSTDSVTAHLHTNEDDHRDGIGFDLAFYSDADNYQCGGHVLNPGVLTTPSFVFTDGSSSLTELYPSMNCEWLIRPNGGASGTVARIDLFFHRVDMTGGTLSVYEGSSTGGDLLWYCDACKFIPSLISAANSSMFIKMRTFGSSDSFGLGFKATYYSVYDGAAGPGDGRITLHAGAAPLVESPAYATDSGASSLPKDLDLEYLIPSKSGRISLSFVDMWFQDSGGCGDNVTIFDGASRTDRILASYCASSRPMNWVVSNNTANALLIVLRTNGDDIRGASFSFAYFSDTDTDGCGHSTEPGTMVAPSMTFNDGSASTSSMRSNTYCEWRVQPSNFLGEVTLLFTRVQLIGGNLTVYDTTKDLDSTILWNCDGCSDVPPALVSNNSLFIVYKTGTGTRGSGFQAHYSTLEGLGHGGYALKPGGRPRTWQGGEGKSLLRMPVYGDSNLDRPFWHLSVPKHKQEQSLRFGAGVGTSCHGSQLNDGSIADERLRKTLDFAAPQMCGVYATGGTSPKLVTEQSTLYERQNNPRIYWAERKQPRCSRFQNLSGVLNYDRALSRNNDNETLFAASTDCHWLFKPSQSAKKLSIEFDELQVHEAYFVKIYAGTSDGGQLLLDCQGCDISGKKFTSTCGSLYLRHERNTSDEIAFTDGNVTGAVFKARVHFRRGKPKGRCLDDPLWAPPKKEKETISLGAIIVFALLLVMVVAGVGAPLWVFVIRKRLYPEAWEQQEVVKKFQKVSAVQRHPMFTPRLDQFRNIFLRKHECSICYTEEKAFRFECKHSVCFECTQNYMASALGDASMFPLKCPMHHTGCLSTIGPEVSKRVLSKDEYLRFCSFLDRAVLGEGINCLKCNLFVNLPENASNPMVQCPYCRHRFCHKCKTDWHTGMRCEERPDQELEQWRASKGAMKCPGCYKIIEKDDPDTCNHMVHKATDGMPCLRDRTDFCYCCGMEVLPDYPHEELGTGINHFPDGVFNDCRVVNDGYAVALMKRTNERAANNGRPARGRNRSRIGRRRATAANTVFPEVELDDLTQYFNR